MTQPRLAFRGPNGRRYPHVAALGLAAVYLGLVAIGACGWSRPTVTDAGSDADPGPQPTLGGRAVFADWPKEPPPDAVVVLSGETFGLLQPCGCSRPQKGGLERRAELIAGLKAKGWPVVAFDLGDLYPPKGLVEDQSRLKYRVVMNALREMGYVAVGVGPSEFAVGIDTVLGEYALQKEQPPYVLAGNLLGLFGDRPQPREQRFPQPPGGSRPLVGLAEVVTVGTVSVGVVGVVGKGVAEEARKLDPSITFEETRDVLARAAAALAAHPRRPQLNVLLYQGPSDAARKLAEDWPQFRVVLCRSDDPEPPQFPEAVAGPKHPAGQKTLVVQVGHKGRYVGVVGAYRVANGFDLKYQLVPLGEEYVTPGPEEAARKANPILPLLESYAEQVRDRNFLAQVVKTPHPAQIQEPKLNLTYVGSEKCQGCHAAEYAKWKETAHSHALEALEKIAKRPSLRYYDPECVQCHVVGLLHATGYQNQKQTPHLAHVGCESCHGPGSGHVADPRSPQLLALLSPWKTEPGDRLPDLATIKKIAALPPLERGREALKPAEQLVFNRVSSMCAKCHDHENDPHFDLFTYWPKVFHSYRKN